MFKALIAAFAIALIVGGTIGFIGGAVGVDTSLLAMVFGGLSALLTCTRMVVLSATRKSIPAAAAAREDWLAITAPADAAALYFVRSGFTLKAAGMDIEIDGKNAAQLKSSEFTRVDIAPGRHRIGAGMSGGAARQAKPGEIELDCTAGEAVVLHLTLGAGLLKAKTLIDRLEGKTAVTKLKAGRAVLPAA